MGAVKRGSRLRGPFLFLVLALATFMGWIYLSFDSPGSFSAFDSYIVPSKVDVVENRCNGSTDAFSSRISSSVNAPCNQSCTCKDVACPPVQEKVKIVVEEKIVEKKVEVKSDPVFKQWWAKGKPWHTPDTFPQCSMDVCFNFSRCQNQDELLVYQYDVPSPPVRFFQGFNSTQWYTADPDIACLFFVFQDLDSPWRPHPKETMYWNHGLNHVLITFADIWIQRNPPADTIENASVLSSSLLETTYRPGFDIGIPLWPEYHYRQFQSLKQWERKYFLTFRGTRYLQRGPAAEGTFRSRPELREMHNGEDVIVVTSCNHGINDMMRSETPEVGVGCDDDQILYDKYDLEDLFNSTFCLTPAGVSGSSYRFIEALSAGAIPVLVADNHVKPFETLIQWPRCTLQFPTEEMHRILPSLRNLAPNEIEERQKYCLWVYNEFLKDDKTVMRSVIRALKTRFFGMFPKFSESSSIYAAI